MADIDTTSDKEVVFNLVNAVNAYLGEFCKSQRSITNSRLESALEMADLALKTFKGVEGQHAKLFALPNTKFVVDLPLQSSPKYSKIIVPYSNDGEFDPSQTYFHYIHQLQLFAVVNNLREVTGAEA